MEKILLLLQKANFSGQEANVYLTLLKNPNLNGSQLAKILNISRSSVYSALDSLYDKGAVILIAGDSNLYQAENPESLMESLKNKFSENANVLKEELCKIKVDAPCDDYCNLKGYYKILSKTRELLLSAKKEVYLNSDFEMALFEDEIKEIAAKGVRIILFTFDKHEFKDLPIEVYYNDSLGLKCPNNKKILMVVDYKKALMAGKDDGSEFIGTFSENKLMVSLISEHIHHDIYLYKFRKKYGDDLFEKDVLLGTIQEKTFHDKIMRLKGDTLGV